jgi:hypothetical protein
MERTQVEELVYQALETELGGVQVYTTALRCDRRADALDEQRRASRAMSRVMALFKHSIATFNGNVEAVATHPKTHRAQKKSRPMDEREPS